MAQFIRLNVVNYLINEHDETCRALLSEVVLKVELINGMQKEDLPGDDYGFKGVEGTEIFLNEEGVRLFEKNFFKLEKNICRNHEASLLVADNLNFILSRIK